MQQVMQSVRSVRLFPCTLSLIPTDILGWVGRNKKKFTNFSPKHCRLLVLLCPVSCCRYCYVFCRPTWELGLRTFSYWCSVKYTITVYSFNIYWYLANKNRLWKLEVGKPCNNNENNSCLTAYYRFGLGWAGSWKLVGWIWLGPVNWTHVHLCRYRVRVKDANGSSWV